MAEEALREDRYTGNVLDDFNLSMDRSFVTNIFEGPVDDRSVATRSTVKASNLDRPLSDTSATQGSRRSNDDNDARRRASLITRIMFFVGFILLGMSILCIVALSVVYPSLQTSAAKSPSDPYEGPVWLIPPTAAPTPSRADIFATTEAPSVACPPRVQPPRLSGKKGVGLSLNDQLHLDLSKLLELNPYWNYSWGPRQALNQPNFLEFCPMIWGANNYDKTVTKMEQSLSNANFVRLLGFNEPDSAGQANMDVDTAIERWPLLEAVNVPLVSPSAKSPTGEWMKEFIRRADDLCLRVDWIGVHWYGNVSFEKFKEKLEEVYEAYGGRSIMITEFATADWLAQDRGYNQFDQAEILAFMKEALPWLERTEWIAGYSWFNFPANHTAGGPSALFDATGQVTPIGRYYASVRADSPMGDQSISV